jgi:cytidylate kinase
MKKGLIITIDGPSGAGKSTVAKILARSLGYAYIDTGAMYRGIAYAYKAHGSWLMAHGENPSNDGDKAQSSMEDFLYGLPIRFEFGETARVFLDDIDISEEIRAPEISLLASNLSQKKEVRMYLTKKQRETGEKGGIVMEGRDTGSVVFPDADIKFYLDANPDERVKRRHLELSAKGVDSEISSVKEEMSKRDKDDSEREIAPLIVPNGAVIIDTTGVDAKGAADMLINHIQLLER